MKLKKEEYSARVSTASPIQLVIINFELIISNINGAKEELERKNNAEFLKHISSAKEFLNLLMTSLDMSYDLSKDLMRNYIFINSLLIKSEITMSAAPAVTACELLTILSDSFKKIPDPEQDGGAAMQNAQHIYAGLTYKNGKLAEYVEEEADRGFKA